MRLLRAFWQAVAIVRRVQPQVVVGLGGYISFPGGLMSVACGKPLVLHEQNSVAGMANKVLASIADKVFSAFPDVLKKAQWVGNPLRQGFMQQALPAERFAGRTGPLKLLVVGGSLGAKALNDIVPQALALIPEANRPQVIHQSGAKQIDELHGNYAAVGIVATLSDAEPPQGAKAPTGGSAAREAASVGVMITPFIDDTAKAFADADLIICRAGASTVTEIAAVGAAAVFVPFPFAVDDHQTTNARFLVDQGAGWLVPQSTLTAPWLANLLQKIERTMLMDIAEKAKKMQKMQATEQVVAACEELSA
jgi:UDP-N-acetylglucosamine--N-acetylmuramyl-(pentapeptide) pyrophosphoryl-undecaprenol N-acetylglucosamine transferase